MVDEGTSKPKNNKTVAKSADILSRPRLAKEETSDERQDTISRKLHHLSEDIKEVAHAVSSSISHSSASSPSSPAAHNNNTHNNGIIIKKPHRTKQKIAKRQAAQLQAQLDAQIESSLHPVIDHRKLENEALHRICLSLHLQIFEIIPDGHCLYSAISDQLNLLNLNQQEKYTYKDCRQLASEYMRSNQDEFINYLVGIEEQQGDGDGDGEEGCLMTGIQYSNYCDKVRDSACWGGQPEILALSKALKFRLRLFKLSIQQLKSQKSI
ncbi:hypothetical protein H4Q26_009822 [Puccinia striiformis f. sp. tritici PST-130]|nr:hypothetical protein H4Q26_009822 [Puccinia striiformis f. sp. tritici PST-130]